MGELGRETHYIVERSILREDAERISVQFRSRSESSKTQIRNRQEGS
jgi:hypothetical protein